MNPLLILTILKMLPDIMSDLHQITSLTGNTQAKIDAVVQMVINALPDSLAPTIIPELKLLLGAAVKVYDEIAGMITHAAAPSPTVIAAAAPASVQITGTLTGVASSLGAAMPAE